ncbi:BON domain-containing protein [Chryseobacterium daecheongense]|uniref:BON domain-containing protein n=1 Tax=Chryseobacterium daecheongense TaxID=192389 RepID=A0A3N0W400_9FLAO|nr:BON domain-containing protein [Chryseobacterium daecheongense]ROH99795.1 BON domain-containing protein [Chryseobacterium daecheongense]TDX95276.1 osmotically-inducible protein OsmY [Chryseobacterium daecheongense]
MKTNAELQKDVQDAIKWEPLLHSAEIGVTAKNGVVSLTGIVDSYAKKMQAEDAAKNVVGVKVLVENIKVKFPNSRSKTDIEIADEIIAAFESNTVIPEKQIKVKVEDGWVDLDGELPWDYLREITENAIQYLPGVKGIYNNITIKPEIRERVDKKDIEEALKRSPIDDKEIKVSVSGSTVTLTGAVHSWRQKEEAGRIAWKTPGIEHVKNELKVDYEYDF